MDFAIIAKSCSCEISAFRIFVKIFPNIYWAVNLTTSLRRHFVKYMPNTLSNPLLFFVEKKCENPLQCKSSHIFSTKNNSGFAIFVTSLSICRIHYQIHCCFFVEKKCENPLQCKSSHIFSTKNNSGFAIFMFEILTKR